MNICSFTGRLTADPELKATHSGISVCSFTLAVKRPHVKDITDFINFTSWRQSAEYLAKYGAKGNLVEVTGTLQSEKFTDKDGNNRTSFKVVADSLSIIESRSNSNPSVSAENDPLQGFAQHLNGMSQGAITSGQQGDFEEILSDEDLPF